MAAIRTSSFKKCPNFIALSLPSVLALLVADMIRPFSKCAITIANSFSILPKSLDMVDDNGQFSKPESIDIDSFGHVYVADTDNNNVQLFAPN